MYDANELLGRVAEFLEETEQLTEMPTNPVGAVVGIPPGIAAHYYGKKKIKKLSSGSKRRQRTKVRDFSFMHPTLAKSYIPKNERAMKKLAKRDAVSHVGHGALRYFGAPLGFTNTIRYGHKVRAARKGLHRKM